MKKLFAAIVASTGQVFYVAEEEIAKAAKTLSRLQPSLSEESVTFHEIPGSVAEFLKLKKGGVQEWPPGTTVILEKLTGPVKS